jgi:hypothetical protein
LNLEQGSTLLVSLTPLLTSSVTRSMALPGTLPLLESDLAPQVEPKAVSASGFSLSMIDVIRTIVWLISHHSLGRRKGMAGSLPKAPPINKSPVFFRFP